MKIYLINDAEKLKQVVPLMKSAKERDRAAHFARVWSATSRKTPDKAARFSARLEIGRGALLFKVHGEDVELLGNVNLNAAREFVKEAENENNSRIV